VKPSGPSSQLTPIGTSTQPKGEGTPIPTKTKTPGFDIVMAVVSISGYTCWGEREDEKSFSHEKNHGIEHELRGFARM